MAAPSAVADPFPAEFDQHFDRRPVRLANPYPAGIPAPKGACHGCGYAPCACSATDAATDLILEAAHFGGDLDLPGWDER